MVNLTLLTVPMSLVSTCQPRSSNTVFLY